MIRRPPRSTLSSSSAASDVYKRQPTVAGEPQPETQTQPVQSAEENAEGKSEANPVTQEVAQPMDEVEETGEETRTEQKHESPQPPSGRRQRKEVARFEVEEIKTSAPITIQDGAGTRLGDLEQVKERLDKYSGSSDEAKALHKIIWGRPGQVHKVKKALHDFSGLVGSADPVLDRANRLSSSVLRTLCKILGVHQGRIPDMAQNIVEFLQEPKGSGSKRKSKSSKPSQPKKKPKSTPPPTQKKVVHKTEVKAAPGKESAPLVEEASRSEPVCQEPAPEQDQVEQDSEQAVLYREKVRAIMEGAGDQIAGMSCKSIRKQIEAEMGIKIVDDDKKLLSEITTEMFHTMTN
eukprot:TRINITY_DN13988_c0_g1_i2.p1 TRINITY_DN13988_c0_g1~~TRINITY_DN13988_c0_g1_i2.p1  ORF type:complete len:349 (-),score=72.29 TRINITY_DN13988_c0_g1_i2:304-1350(-)